jgi:hypothetical protein
MHKDLAILTINTILSTMNRSNTLFGRILLKFSKNDAEKRVLGRWAIDSCDKKTNAKIDWSNEDHCGPCGQSILKLPLPVDNPPIAKK